MLGISRFCPSDHDTRDKPITVGELGIVYVYKYDRSEGKDNYDRPFTSKADIKVMPLSDTDMFVRDKLAVNGPHGSNPDCQIWAIVQVDCEGQRSFLWRSKQHGQSIELDHLELEGEYFSTSLVGGVTPSTPIRDLIWVEMEQSFWQPNQGATRVFLTHSAQLNWALGEAKSHEWRVCSGSVYWRYGQIDQLGDCETTVRFLEYGHICLGSCSHVKLKSKERVRYESVHDSDQRRYDRFGPDVLEDGVDRSRYTKCSTCFGIPPQARLEDDPKVLPKAWCICSTT